MKSEIETDNDIIAYVKNLFTQNRIASSVQLFFNLYELGGKEEFDPPKVFKCAQNNVDEMVVKLFDLSLTSKISSVFPSMPCYGQCGAFDMVVVPSLDGQTNITEKLIDFFKVLVNPFALERLKEPFRGNPVAHFNLPSLNVFSSAVLTPFNPWEAFVGLNCK